jgi:hypothetical protein
LTVLSIIQAEVEVEVEVGAEARKDPLHLRM